ncbi:MAG: DIP1984 family protein [Muribaculaceae bacterium]|nr:DIP1984 family protein [Muribaculaceae bacterium]
MKIAEALAQRADLQKRIAQMDGRLKAACRVQEGDEPAERPAELFGEFDRCVDELERLIRRINRTNQSVVLSDGATIADKIAVRDVLKMKVQQLQGLLSYLSERADRYTRQEIRYVNTVDVKDVRRQADDCSRRLRETDCEIQSANWLYDLME